jgi:hypothetical protein
MPRQLDMFAAAREPEPEPAACRFHRRPQIDRSGMAQYLHLIRAKDDPERASWRTWPTASRGRSTASPSS